jgi:hypothetical protein
MLKTAFEAGWQAAMSKYAAPIEALQQAYRRLNPVRINGASSWLGPIFNPKTNAILTPAGGAVRAQRIWGAPSAVTPEAQRAVNVIGGMHEGLERSSMSKLGPNAAPFHGHHSPLVLLNENNMLAGMTGPGTAEARQTFQNMRGMENERAAIEAAVNKMSGGRMPYVYGETKLPRAMKQRLIPMLGEV